MPVARLRQACATATITFAAVANLTASAGDAAPLEETPCISARDREWVSQMYAATEARFGLATVARELLDLDREQRALHAQLAACSKTTAPPAAPDCATLEKQIRAGEPRLAELSTRFKAALDMESYLSTLELRLARPLCKD